MAAIVAAVGWLAGLYLAPGLPLLGLVPMALLLGGIGGVALLWRSAAPARVGALALLVGVLAVARGQVASAPLGPGSIVDYAGLAGGPVEVRGSVVAEPERGATGTRVRIAAEEARSPAMAGTTYGHLLVSAPRGEWRYGDRVVVVGRIELPLDRDDAPLAELLARQGLAATMRASEVRLLERAEPSPWALLYELKAVTGEALDRRLPAPMASLARGLLLGGTAGMPPDVVDSFRRAGMSHIVAVSGYNITLVAAALLPVGALLPRFGGGLGLPAVGVVAFTLLVGAPASAVRAAIMGGLVLLARRVGRPPDAIAALAVAVLAMTAAEPALLRDLGFLLSSLATLAIVAVMPLVDGFLPGKVRTRDGLGGATGEVGITPWGLAGLREILVASLAVELLTVPLTALSFGRVAALSPLANLLALPAVPVAMAASLPLAATPFLPDALLAPVGWLAWVPLAWIIAVVEACAAPSWASLPVGPVPVGLAWAWYAGWAAILLILYARSCRFSLPSPRSVFDRTPAGWVVGTAALAAVAAWAGALSVPDAAPRLTVFESSGATLFRNDAEPVGTHRPGRQRRRPHGRHRPRAAVLG